MLVCQVHCTADLSGDSSVKIVQTAEGDEFEMNLLSEDHTVLNPIESIDQSSHFF